MPPMDFQNSAARFFIPDGESLNIAFSRSTHLGIGAHQDDLEFMAYHGILECFQSSARWFAGVTCTDGHGSVRMGPYAKINNEELARIRILEQNTAAVIGQYGSMIQLGYKSAEVNNPLDKRLTEDLTAILRATKPDILYTHNPADKHRTHLGVFSSVLAALRSLPKDQRPAKVIGCEVWRNLDWMPDNKKVCMNVSGRDNLAAALNGVFDSQIAGGKRYDLAVAGRRAANGTFSNPHAMDETNSAILGMDLTPLILDDTIDPVAFTLSHIECFAAEVRDALAARFPG